MEKQLYGFTNAQLATVLHESIKLFIEFRDKHGRDEVAAALEAVDEVIGGLDVDRELAETDPHHETLKLQTDVVAKA